MVPAFQNQSSREFPNHKAGDYHLCWSNSLERPDRSSVSSRFSQLPTTPLDALPRLEQTWRYRHDLMSKTRLNPLPTEHL